MFVNLYSVSGLKGSSDAFYGASKAAILDITKKYRNELLPCIRVNVVVPTMVYGEGDTFQKV